MPTTTDHVPPLAITPEQRAQVAQLKAYRSRHPIMPAHESEAVPLKPATEDEATGYRFMGMHYSNAGPRTGIMYCMHDGITLRKRKGGWLHDPDEVRALVKATAAVR